MCMLLVHVFKTNTILRTDLVSSEVDFSRGNLYVLVMLPEKFRGSIKLLHCPSVYTSLHPLSFPGHNFVVCGWIKVLCGTIDHHDMTTCRAQNSSHYLQGQCHRATLKQIGFQAITVLFMVEFRYCLVQLICRAHNSGC